MSFWLYFSTSIIASTAASVEAAELSGEMSLVKESGIKESVSCEEIKAELSDSEFFMQSLTVDRSV